VGELFSFDLSVVDWIIFAVAGVVTGVINTLAGSGSLITLPIFVFLCGLPAPVANGTNRIGVLIQSGVALQTYRKTHATSFEGSIWLVIPAVAGALIGSRFAVDLDEETMRTVLGLLMLFMMVVLVVKPSRWLHEQPVDLHRGKHPLTLAVFFLIGVYGGFIQAGVGIFLLTALVLINRYSLSSGNGIKLLIVLAYGIPATAIFFLHGQVHIGYGLAMAVFQGSGAWLAVKWVARFEDADKWIHRLLILIVAISAAKFLL